MVLDTRYIRKMPTIPKTQIKMQKSKEMKRKVECSSNIVLKDIHAFLHEGSIELIKSVRRDIYNVIKELYLKSIIYIYIYHL